MTKTRIVLLIISGVLITSPVYASYSNGFFGIIIVVFALPVAIAGFVVTLILCSRNKFLDDPFYFKYMGFWGIAALIAFVSTSAMSLDGSDPESPLLILSGLIVYLLIILGPAFFQRRTTKSEK